jgi:hypothetical protein
LKDENKKKSISKREKKNNSNQPKLTC